MIFATFVVLFVIGVTLIGSRIILTITVCGIIICRCFATLVILMPLRILLKLLLSGLPLGLLGFTRFLLLHMFWILLHELCYKVKQ